MNSKVGGSLPEKRILAIFQPQEWVDGPEGAARDVGCAATFDATKAVLRMPLAFIHRLKDASEDADYIHTYSACSSKLPQVSFVGDDEAPSRGSRDARLPRCGRARPPAPSTPGRCRRPSS